MTELPRPSDQHPRRGLLRVLRPVARAGVGTYWDVKVHDRTRVPADGPVILASNHTGWLDGPLLTVLSPRPVHALTKQEMFAGRLGPVLRAAGQIPLDRFGADPSAVKSCLRVLRDGGVVGIFPEGTRGAGEFDVFHHGVTYLALASGAPVVPVTQVGTRARGAHSGDLPPRGSTIDMVFGQAWSTPRLPWPRTREHILATSLLIWEHLRQEQARALALLGRSLPGPLPAGDREADPATGFGSHADDYSAPAGHTNQDSSPPDQQGAP